MNIWQQVMMNQPDMEGMGPLNNEAFLSQQTPQRAPAGFRPAPPPPPMPEEEGREPASARRRKANANPLQAMLGEQEQGVQSLEDIARQYAEYVNQKKGQTDLSPLLQLSDSLFGSSIAKGYDAPPTEEEVLGKKAALQKEINAARQPMAQELLRQYASDNSAESKYLSQLAKMTGQTDKDSRELGKQVMFQRGIPGEVRRPIATLDRIGKAYALIENIEKDQQGALTGIEMAELGAALATSVTGSNVLTDHQMKAFVPPGVDLTGAAIGEWLTGTPMTVEKKEWLKMFKKTLYREQLAAKRSVRGYQQALLSRDKGIVPEERHKAISSAGEQWLSTSFPDIDMGTVRIEHGGQVYNLPPDQVEAFKADKGIK